MSTRGPPIRASLQEVIEVVAERCSLLEEPEDAEVEIYEFRVDDTVYYFDYYFDHAGDVETARPTWRLGQSAEGTESRVRADEAPVPDDARFEARVLECALRRMLRNPAGRSFGGFLRDDLGRALLDAAIEVLENRVVERVITVGDLNVMFGVNLGDYSDPAADQTRIPLDDRREGASLVAEYLVTEWDFESLISSVVAGPVSIVDVAPGGEVGVYEFTFDDGVYYFDHASDLEAGEPSWWFAHPVNDSEAREHARGVGPRELWDVELFELEQGT